VRKQSANEIVEVLLSTYDKNDLVNGLKTVDTMSEFIVKRMSTKQKSENKNSFKLAFKT